MRFSLGECFIEGSAVIAGRSFFSTRSQRDISLQVAEPDGTAACVVWRHHRPIPQRDAAPFFNIAGASPRPNRLQSARRASAESLFPSTISYRKFTPYRPTSC